MLFYIRYEKVLKIPINIIDISISDIIISFFIECHLWINLNDIYMIQNDSDILLYIEKAYFIDKYGMQYINKSIHYLTLSAN